MSIAPLDSDNKMVSDSVSAQHEPAYSLWQIIGNLLAGLWIFGGLAFFFIRFTSIFYFANKDAFDTFFQRFHH